MLFPSWSCPKFTIELRFSKTDWKVFREISILLWNNKKIVRYQSTWITNEVYFCECIVTGLVSLEFRKHEKSIFGSKNIINEIIPPWWIYFIDLKPIRSHFTWNFVCIELNSVFSIFASLMTSPLNSNLCSFFVLHRFSRLVRMPLLILPSLLLSLFSQHTEFDERWDSIDEWTNSI